MLVRVLRDKQRISGRWPRVGEELDLDDDLAHRLIHGRFAEPVHSRQLFGGMDKMVRGAHHKVLRGRDVLAKRVRPDAPLYVVIPTYNRHEYLRATLESLSGQHVAKVIVVNDGGDSFSLGSEVKVIEHSVNRGVNAARRTAIREIPDGGIVVELDDHDLLEPNALEDIRKLFENPNTMFVYGDYWQINRDDEASPTHPLCEKPDYEPGLFRRHGNLASGVRAYRKTLYDAVGGYREEEFPAGDYALFLRMEAFLGDCGFVRAPKPLCQVRVIEGSISIKYGPEQNKNADRFRQMAEAGTLIDAKSAIEKLMPEELPVRERLYQNGEEVSVFVPNDCEVSIIIPCYNRRDLIMKCLRSLKGVEQPAHEIILVDDNPAANQRLHELVWDWSYAKVVALHENTGFGYSNNAGAKHADGEYILLLNSDTVATPNFLAPMVDLMEDDESIGAVGNKQLCENGRISSIGSEFDYKTGSFEHLGKYAREDIELATKNREVDMCTGACLMVRADLWRQLGGFDEEFKKAYYEDTDLCLRVRDAGYRIRYCADSAIEHKMGGSGVGCNHQWYRANRELFHARWVRTGKVDKFIRQRGQRVHDGDVVACYIVLNEEEYIRASLESIYDFVDRIVIVEGGNDFSVAAGWCGPDKRSTDSTIQEIESFPDPQGKITLIQGEWKDKEEQRTEYTKHLNDGDWLLIIDGDEVYSDAGIWRLSYLMHHYDVISPHYWSFWNNFETVGTGVWDTFIAPRAIKWHAGYHYSGHLQIHTREGVHILQHAGLRTVVEREKLFYHYSWVKPVEKLRAKLEYYKHQPAHQRPREKYIDDIFLAWQESPKRIEAMYGTHPFGGGWAESFGGKHPEPMAQRLRNNMFGFGEGNGSIG